MASREFSHKERQLIADSFSYGLLSGGLIMAFIIWFFYG